MIPKDCTRLAEVDFPIAEVSRHAAQRTYLEVSRALVKAAPLVVDPFAGADRSRSRRCGLRCEAFASDSK